MSSLDDDDVDPRYEIDIKEDAAELHEDFMDLQTILKEADEGFYLNVAYPIFQAIRYAGKISMKRFWLTVKVRSQHVWPDCHWNAHHPWHLYVTQGRRLSLNLPTGKTKDCRDVLRLPFEGIQSDEPLQTLCQVLTQTIESFATKMMEYSKRDSKKR